MENVSEILLSNLPLNSYNRSLQLKRLALGELRARLNAQRIAGVEPIM